jgi:imidazolonepropionase-like amidohydrolase
LSIDPQKYSENEAWILFQLNDRPVQTQADGDFNALAIMDVSSGLIHGMELLSSGIGEISEFDTKKLLNQAEARVSVRPRYLFVDAIHEHSRVKRAATVLGIKTVSEEGKHLDTITEEARAGFSARFTMGPR